MRNVFGFSRTPGKEFEQQYWLTLIAELLKSLGHKRTVDEQHQAGAMWQGRVKPIQIGLPFR